MSENIEIHLSFGKELIDEIKEMSGIQTNKKVIEDAMTIFRWALLEKKKFRHILSSDSEGRDVHRLVMESLKHD